MYNSKQKIDQLQDKKFNTALYTTYLLVSNAFGSIITMLFGHLQAVHSVQPFVQPCTTNVQPYSKLSALSRLYNLWTIL